MPSWARPEANNCNPCCIALMWRQDHAYRVGLSATLADESASCAFLRPLAPDAVCVLPRSSLGQELKLQLRGYVTQSRKRRAPASGDKETRRA